MGFKALTGLCAVVICSVQPEGNEMSFQSEHCWAETTMKTQRSRMEDWGFGLRSKLVQDTEVGGIGACVASFHWLQTSAGR